MRTAFFMLATPFILIAVALVAAVFTVRILSGDFWRFVTEQT